MAVDFGQARIGVAVSTIDALFSSPLATLTNSELAISELVQLVDEQEPIEIYVGLPLNLQGEYTKSTELAIEFARELSSSTSVPVRMIDERLSTRAAQSQIQSSGKNTKQARRIIDAAAASLILESAIDYEKSNANIPGKAIADV